MRIIDADALYLGKFVEPRTEWHQGWNEALDAATTQAPTIDPESLRATGEWIEHEFEEEPCCGTEYECSVCGMYQYDNTNYCPNCGAKMKEAT